MTTVPAYKEKYLESHVRRIDHAEDRYKKMREHSSGQHDDSPYEKCDENVGGPEIEPLSEFIEWRE